MIRYAWQTMGRMTWLRQVALFLVSLGVGALATGTVLGVEAHDGVTESVRMQIQLGHSQPIQSAVFSPDGQWILTASTDRTAVLWDVATGQELRRLQGHTDLVNSAVFSVDGRLVLTASNDKTARLWDIATGRELRRFEGHTNDVNSAVFAPDGRTILTASFDNTARLWDVATGQELRRFEDPDNVTTAVFAPDGRTILTASFDNTTCLWDVATGQELHRFGVPARSAYNGQWVRGLMARLRLLPTPFAVFSPDGQVILTTKIESINLKQDATVSLWDVASGLEISRFVGHTGALVSAAFSPDGRTVLTSSFDKTARLWDVATGRELRRFAGHADLVSAVFAPDGRWILLASKTTASLWNVATAEELRRFEGRTPFINSATFTIDKHAILTASSDKTARLWDIATGQELRRFTGHSNSVQSAVFSPDGRRILTASFDKTARLWDVATGQELRRFENSSDVTFAIFSPDGAQILVTGYLHACLWDTTTGQELRCFKHQQGVMTRAVFDPDGRKVLTASVNTVRLWDVATGQELRRFEGHTASMKSAIFHPNGRWVLTASADKTARLWDANTGQEVRRFEGHTDMVTLAVFDPTGHTILTRSADGTMRLWETATGQELRHFEGYSGYVQDVAFSQDGRWILIAGGDSIRLWDVQNGKELARLVSFTDDTWVVATPEGRFDTDNVEQIKGLHWIMSDDPFRALPLEIFMRDYYEPRLLPRVLAREKFKELPSLDQLNRAQPMVAIMDVQVEDPQTGLVTVTMEVANGFITVKRGDKSVEMESGAYDLRLFRNGQLVGQFPDPQDEPLLGEQARDQVLAQWRKQHAITLDPKTGKKTITFRGVKLPRTVGLKEVEFSAYAFNVDRVKSATARRTLPVPTDLTPRQGRAYVVTIGVNRFENNRMPPLTFAVNDATRLNAELSARLKTVIDAKTDQPHFGEAHVIPVTLVTDSGSRTDHGALNQATKRRIKAVIDKLAGKSVDPIQMEGIPNADRLQPVQPEDLVLLSFSTHGDTDKDGEFYLMPSDLGESSDQQDLRRHAISSEELSAWLRPVDAGEMVMIVDACHSAATVENQEFKPGPMGSRGLGQLAFDKGMRILAASQRDQAALETERTQQGLLTYALVREGLTDHAADFKPKDSRIQLSEWLAYGVERVPGLYEDYRTGKLKARAATPLDQREGKQFISIQQPALFDFARGRDLPLVSGGAP